MSRLAGASELDFAMGQPRPLTAGIRGRPAESLRIKPACWALVAGTATAVGAARSPSVVVTALGLGYAASTDWTERRVPGASIRVAGGVAAALILATSWTNGEWPSAARAVTAAAVVFATLGWLWWIAPSALGFGDVKAVTLATAAAAATSWRASVHVLLATIVTAQIVVAAYALARRRTRVGWHMTVPFVPALCTGYVVGLWTV